jgi:hypothetical protein
MNIKRQAGTTSVEFAIVGMVMMVCLLGVIEVSRLLFVINALGESTRRGARLAAVCPVDDPAIAQMAVFNSTGGTNSPVVNGLSTANVQLEYLDVAGAPITVDLSIPANYATINYVRVQIVNYVHQWIFPGALTFNMPPQPSTLPRESLGVPRNEPIQSC